MSTTVKPYSTYRDSEVPGLGNLPVSWPTRRIKRVAQINPSKSEVRSVLATNPQVSILRMEQVTTDGRFHPNIQALTVDTHAGLTYFRRNDVILAKITPCFENGKGALLDSLPTPFGFGSTEFIVLRAGPEIRPKYLWRLTTLPIFRQLGADAMTGAAGQQRVPPDFVANFTVPVPPSDEQAAIVRFLDHHDRLIRRYIAAKRKLIVLLNEQKRAIIHQAVTRGIHANLTLKASGDEWLGEIPAHWDVRRLRYAVDMRVSNIDKHSKEAELPVRLCNYVHVYKNERITATLPFMSATATSEEIQQFAIKRDDVIITKDSETWDDIGVPALVECEAPDLVCGYHLAILRPHQRLLLGAYLLRILQSPSLAHQFHIRANGVTRYGLSHGALKAVRLPVPPLEEQRAIVEAVDHSTDALDRAIAAAQREITLLREYHTRLVSDVVTGTRDVQEAAKTLPDLPVEADDELISESQPMDAEELEENFTTEEVMNQYGD